MKSQRLLIGELAGIEYVGLHGITACCLSALTCLLNGGELIERACLITSGQDHAFLLNAQFGRDVAVKAGFTSGYVGEGPSGLATALAILCQHNVEIEEYEVGQAFMDRLNCSCLLEDDLNLLDKSKSVRPQRWYDYIYAVDGRRKVEAEQLSHYYPTSIPFALVDPRIIDLAVNFAINSDDALLKAYRRLEGIVKKRTNLPGEGNKLFSAAFQGDGAMLKWDVADRGEVTGRAQLFTAVYAGFRNARAHREIEADSRAELREFLLVNELYCLEAEALTEDELDVKRASDAEIEKINQFKKQE